MKISSCKPDKKLDHIFKEYYFIQLNTDNNNSKKIPIIDDCSYDIVFYIGSSANFYYSKDQIKIPLKSKILTIHNLTPPYKLEFKNKLSFFTIKLQPWLNSKFFSYISDNGIINLEYKYPELIDLYDKTFSSFSFEEQKEIVNNFMLQKKIELNNSMSLSKNICERIRKKQGVITVLELTKHYGKSRQYLNRVFKKEVMYSLKHYITSVRILDLIQYRLKKPNLSLTEVCYEYNYFDQSHFINDFKKICGITPRVFFNNTPEFLLRH